MKVLIAMSGGLKSLVTAWLLKKQGMQVRGVYLDLLGPDESMDRVGSLERKLGISIQIIPVQKEFSELLGLAQKNAFQNGDLLDPGLFFHRSFLFPRLLELKEQHQFDRLATGHRVLVQEDQISKVFRVFQNADGDFSEVPYLLGRTQKELSSLLLPLGSIPSSMFGKLSLELDTGGTQGGTITWDNKLKVSEPESALPFEVLTATGNRLGIYHSVTLPSPGQVYRLQETPELIYRIIDVSFEKHQMTVASEPEMRLSELQFCDVSWFAHADLGLRPIECSVISPLQKRAIGVRMLQYEGAQIKAFLNQPLEAIEANIFKGQTMLWVEGSEILGGGCVLGTRE